MGSQRVGHDLAHKHPSLYPGRKEGRERRKRWREGEGRKEKEGGKEGRRREEMRKRMRRDKCLNAATGAKR